MGESIRNVPFSAPAIITASLFSYLILSPLATLERQGIIDNYGYQNAQAVAAQTLFYALFSYWLLSPFAPPARSTGPVPRVLPPRGSSSASTPSPQAAGLIRGDSRDPSQVFTSGFKARGTSVDVVKYVETNEASAFVGTTSNLRVAIDFATDKGTRSGWVYAIRNPGGGIDINRYYGSINRINLFSIEEEIAFPGGLQSRDIIGAFKVGPSGKPTGEIQNNPSFVP